MLIHREALELAKNAAVSDDGVAFATTCVNVDEDGRVMVTDVRHWLRMSAAVDEPNLFDELADKGAGVASDGPVLVPAEVMQAFNAAMKKKSKAGMPVPHVVVSQRDGEITLASSDGKTKRAFRFDPVEGVQYPSLDRTVIAHEPVKSVLLSVELLHKIVRALRNCGAESVRLGLPSSPIGPISLSAETLTGRIDGAFAPMRDASDKSDE